MRFLVDECSGPKVAEWLRNKGHDVISIFDDFKGLSDEDVLTKAVATKSILVTNDKDFGEMIFRERREHRGVIFLRLSDERSKRKVEVLLHLLDNYLDRLENQFVTVTESKVRFS